jgi:cellulose synthase/poly-beta-1,6-N-acetylglucosamine synthase-like glycosyltransferase
MMMLLWATLTLLSALVLLPSFVFFAECAASFLPDRARRERAQAGAFRTIVLLPAHDEEAGLRATLESLLPELGPRDAVLVVADNCSDRTAHIARAAGALVIERTCAEKRGKGFALDFGFRHLARETPPDVVVVLDADCRLAPGSLRELAESAHASGRPAQADDVLVAPPRATPLVEISAFAFLVRNRVRPMGLLRLGLPCQLMGTGMALPWPAVHALPSLGAELAEDMMMGVELARRGFAPVYCPRASVKSRAPARAAAAKGQRRRWEHGHMSILFGRVPKLLARSLRTFDGALLAMAIDLLVPPLSFLVLLTAFAFMAMGVAWHLTGFGLPFVLAGASAGLVLGGLLLAWIRCGRQRMRARHLLAVPFYIAWKLPLYASFLIGKRSRSWEPAERESFGGGRWP